MMAKRWCVEWRTTNHPSLGRERDQLRRRLFDNKEEAQRWKQQLETEAAKLCTNAVLFELSVPDD